MLMRSPLARDRRSPAGLRVRFMRSTCPLVQGWLGLVSGLGFPACITRSAAAASWT